MSVSIPRVLSFLLLAAAAVVVAQAQGGSCDVAATEVLHRQSSGVAFQQLRVIETETEWCAFWEEVFSNVSPAPDCDTTQIDFSSEVAVVAAIGNRPNGCYNADISCVNQRGQSDDLRVTVQEIVPGKGCLCTQATVSPVDVVKVPRPVGRVDFFLKKATLSCR